MTIQITFEQAEYISSGVNRDKLVMNIGNPIYFFSKDSLQTVAFNSTSETVLPKMMPDSIFTDFFNGLGDSVVGVAKVTLVTSFVLNLVLSGPLQLLWALINSLQIVTHFPLISVMMPSNAYTMLLTIVKISDFDYLPVEDLIEEMEDSVGIEKDAVVLSENFRDFELDSSDMIRNLQVVFLFMLLLVFMPIAFLLLFTIFKKNSKCKVWLSKMGRALFWNTYIRFWLESYLQLSIASFLRFRQFSFGSASDNFNSGFALTIFLTLVLLLTASMPILQCKPSGSARYSELALGLNTGRRQSMLSPTLFMARRIIYAYILVNWSDRVID